MVFSSHVLHIICQLQHVTNMCYMPSSQSKVKAAHQVCTALLHISFLWEADVNVEELCEVAKEHAVHSGRGGAKEELFGGEQLGDGVQVLERHLPELRFCVPANPLQVRPETVFFVALLESRASKTICDLKLDFSPDFGHCRLKLLKPVGCSSWQVAVFTKF